jgi:hypothetical protein
MPQTLRTGGRENADLPAACNAERLINRVVSHLSRPETCVLKVRVSIGLDARRILCRRGQPPDLRKGHVLGLKCCLRPFQWLTPSLSTTSFFEQWPHASWPGMSQSFVS